MEILRNLLKGFNFFLFLAISLVIFNFAYYVMSTFPGFESNMCVEGAGLNFFNIIFSILLSLLTGIFVVNFIELIKKRKLSLTAASFSSGSVLLGGLTVFCTLCTFSVISIFGISFGVAFFVDYEIWIRIISLILMIFSLYLLEKQLKSQCLVCKN